MVINSRNCNFISTDKPISGGKKTMNIERIIQAGETQMVEFKKSLSQMREGSISRYLSFREKKSLLSRRDRDHHNEPWKCDRCGSVVGMLVSMVITEDGPQKSYRCKCGGDYWPAT